jgi:hypothetical protein
MALTTQSGRAPTGQPVLLGDDRAMSPAWAQWFQEVGDKLPGVGATASRPLKPRLGLSYFDATIGLPIWWNGTAWVNASGGAV